MATTGTAPSVPAHPNPRQARRSCRRTTTYVQPTPRHRGRQL